MQKFENRVPAGHASRNLNIHPFLPGRCLYFRFNPTIQYQQMDIQYQQILSDGCSYEDSFVCVVGCIATLLQGFDAVFVSTWRQAFFFSFNWTAMAIGDTRTVNVWILIIHVLADIVAAQPQPALWFRASPTTAS